MFMAAPKPRAKVNPSKIQGEDKPRKVTALSPAAANNIHPCVTNKNRLLSTTSANAPAGRTTKKTGRLVAVCMRAVNRGEGESEVISHTPPRFCIHVPKFDTREANQRYRKMVIPSGFQMLISVD
jgi:hypothetical protein